MLFRSVLQPLARRVIWATVCRSPGATASYLEGAKLPIPRPLALASAPYVARLAKRVNNASDATVRADLIGLRNMHLGRIEGWIKDGVLGGPAANVADLQIGAALRLLLTIEDLRPLLAGRLVEGLARRWFPSYPGATPAGAFPPAWLDGGH